MLSQMLDAFIGDVFVDGVKVTVADLTFGEQVKLRKFIRDLSPDGDEDEASSAEMVPALVTVVKQRTEPEFTVENALALKEADLSGPPTRAATRRKASS